MKVKYVLSSLLFFVCVFVPFHQSYTEISILYTTPCVQLGAWTVGQSSGNYGETTRPINVSSFITNSEETCCVSISVNYCPDQPSQLNIMYPITSFEYELSMSHGFSEEKKVYSTSGPDASLFDPSTTFSVSAKFTGPSDTESLACAQNGRNNEPMKVTVKFIGYYGSDPNNQKTVNIPLTWTQDSKDMLRQEYVDMTPPDSRAELPVPSRSEFVYTISSNGTDNWNTGHYGYMIDDALKSKKSSWLAEVNKYRTANSLSQFSDTDFEVNSAYRNPYHQRFHVNAPYTASFHSRHCYGDALDVHTIDVDGDNAGVDVDGDGEIDKYIEQVYNNNSKSDDGKLMEEGADDAGALWTASWEYYSTHTHADWTLRASDGGNWPPPAGTVYSTPCSISGTASSGPYVVSTTSTTTTTSSTTLVSSNGSYSASAGSTHEASLSVPSGFSSVYWYVASPSDTGLGTNVETDTGTSSTTSASFSYSFSSDASGDYVITAYTYLSDNSVVQPSYTVSVGSSSTDTTTDNTELCSWCTDGCPSCPTPSTSTTPSTSIFSLSISDPGQTFQPGDTVTLNLVGSESYSSVTWQVDEPWYITPSATNISYTSGDGMSTEASITYTFPSGSMHIGDYLFRAIVYQQSDGTLHEETYTVTVGY